MICEMVELIEYELDKNLNWTKLMCVRGLLMLLHLEQFADFGWLDISEQILTLLTKAFAKKDPLLKRFIMCLPQDQVVEHVQNLQSLLTIKFLASEISSQTLEKIVKVLDIFWHVNQSRVH